MVAIICPLFFLTRCIVNVAVHGLPHNFGPCGVSFSPSIGPAFQEFSGSERLIIPNIHLYILLVGVSLIRMLKPHIFSRQNGLLKNSEN